ncbi:MAG: diguanylate cyclase [Candidatus Aminicenantes bacterium]|nr:diguanylate cyclase [Candidatus Aminicenantes bacterium]
MIKLLVADDDPVSRKILEKHTSSWGFKVYAAKNGKEARDILSKKDIHIALLDWMMPEISGIELCSQIRKKKSENKYKYIILLTSKDNQEDIITGLEAGADDYITKPFNIKEFEARLKTGMRIITLQHQLLKSQKELHRIAIHDSLTGLFNRREITRIFKERFIQARREKRPIGTIILDIDHFKKINDNHGHQIGDAVLVEVAQRLQGNLRPYDKIGRYGGEEFLVILPNCGKASARKVAERLRRTICQTKFKSNNGAINISISLGGAVTERPNHISMNELLRLSDMALYGAKNNGRNRTGIADI